MGVRLASKRSSDVSRENSVGCTNLVQRAGLGAVVKYSPLDQEVLGSSGLSAHLCGGKACLKEIPPQTPPSVGASKHWVRPFF